MPVPGEMLGDRYRLDDRIAGGGMGEVWRATDTVLGRDVAVKTMHAERSVDPGFQERFRHEARSMAALHHRGVADVYDFGETANGADAYIVMERINGEALNTLLAERGRLTVAETMSMVAQAGRALQAAHDAGIVHRDVKPGNLIIEPDGTVVLVDFGVARSTESAALTGAREVVGTALYIAPEQVSKQTTGPLADVYALGAVAYHCLSGHPPFEGDNPIAIAMQHLQDEPPPLPPDVPGPVRELVARAMAKNPADRYPSAEATAEAAERAVPMVSYDASTSLMAAVQGSRGYRPNGFQPGRSGTGVTGPGHTAAFPAGTAAAMGAAGATGATRSGAPAFGVGVAGAGGSSGRAGVPAPVPYPSGPSSDPSGPAVSPSPRRRGLITAAIAVIVLGVAGIALAVFNPDFFSGGGDPRTSVPPAPTGGAAPVSQDAGNGDAPVRTSTKRSTTRPADGGVPTTRPTVKPSKTPSQEPSSSPTPTTAAPTTPAPTDTSDDNGGGDGDNGGGDNDNSGPGGGGGGGGGGEEQAQR